VLLQLTSTRAYRMSQNMLDMGATLTGFLDEVKAELQGLKQASPYLQTWRRHKHKLTSSRTMCVRCWRRRTRWQQLMALSKLLDGRLPS